MRRQRGASQHHGALHLLAHEVQPCRETDAHLDDVVAQSQRQGDAGTGLALARQGVAGQRQHLHQHELHRVGAAPGRGQVRRRFQRDRHATIAAVVAHPLPGALHQRFQIEPVAHAGLRRRHFGQRARGLRGTARLRQHALGLGRAVLVAALVRRGLHRLGRAGNHRQRVVHLVRHARGQRRHGQHLVLMGASLPVELDAALALVQVDGHAVDGVHQMPQLVLAAHREARVTGALHDAARVRLEPADVARQPREEPRRQRAEGHQPDDRQQHRFHRHGVVAALVGGGEGVALGRQHATPDLQVGCGAAERLAQVDPVRPRRGRLQRRVAAHDGALQPCIARVERLQRAEQLLARLHVQAQLDGRCGVGLGGAAGLVHVHQGRADGRLGQRESLFVARQVGHGLHAGMDAVALARHVQPSDHHVQQQRQCREQTPRAQRLVRRQRGDGGGVHANGLRGRQAGTAFAS